MGSQWGHGTLYDGEWKEDKKHGIGTCTFANVDSYEGEWKDDYANGIGIMRWGENGGGPDGAAEGGEAEVSRMATSKPIGEEFAGEETVMSPGVLKTARKKQKSVSTKLRRLQRVWVYRCRRGTCTQLFSFDCYYLGL